jgi:cytochrome c oxidase subunit 2
MSTKPSRGILRAVIWGVLASIVGIAIALAIDWFPVAAADPAEEIDTLWDVLLIVSVPIFVLVMSVVFYCVRHFRAKPGDMSDGAPIHGNTKLEVVWVAIPFAIVTALAIYGWIVLNDIEKKQPNALQVRVTGQQFEWHYAVPGPDGKPFETNQLVVPKDRQVNFKIGTKDVIHDFWVPAFRLKSDAVPGITTSYRVTPRKLGRYDVVCAELCGLGHATMRSSVRVVEPAEYDAWVAKRGKVKG